MEEPERDEWIEVYEEIRKTLCLVAPSGPVPEFLLSIEGGEAWLRWSDRSFDDAP
ncbi:hypothetical protein GCM10010156_77740 [Planobispora rosea]|uniref:Uncharacterized protein n=1 Tax=Planobispora rosea TaxID=35762 RepID=A0A8J3WGG2_PLARO|nr:hypothetical protein [Planobispora rosea]GGT09440.1 hypothetical protein GCM10010156_77740 [Planobispora rosea]GIH89299.1 hypothetical protein Pro02_77070 [Planobispora rosea]